MFYILNQTRSGVRLQIRLYSVIAIAAFTLGLPANATTINVFGPTDSYSSVGDFSAITGNDSASSPGQVLELLGGSSAPPLQNNGFEMNSNSITMGALWSTLDSGGVNSATTLVLGFGLNETGPTGSNSVTISDLQLSFQRPGGSLALFSLLSDEVRIFNFNQGASTAEARFALALGFDFMTEYAPTSTETFDIQATIDNTSDGFEIFFLSSEFTVDAITVPEPSTATLIGIGLVMLCGAKRRRTCR